MAILTPQQDLNPKPRGMTITILAEGFMDNIAMDLFFFQHEMKQRRFLKIWPFSAYFTLPIRLRRWYGHRFHSLDSNYPRDASNQNGNNWSCCFREEVKNQKLLTDDAQRRRNLIAIIGHLRDSGKKLYRTYTQNFCNTCI